MPAAPYHPRHAASPLQVQVRRTGPEDAVDTARTTASDTPAPRRAERAASAAVIAALCALVASSVASAAPLARSDGHATSAGTDGAPLLGDTATTGAAAPRPAAHLARAAGLRPAARAALARITRTKAKAPATAAVIAGLAGNGIPEIALNAYRVAADRMAHVQPSCGIDWALLAGIGREESDHGRFGGARLNRDGTSTPRIIGPALDGTGTQYIAAPANGLALDGDATYTHALGPMQFIPQTWAGYGADANGDGNADIFNINDAALGAARYLCANGGNLRTRAGQVRAILAYNHSDQYVAQVLALSDSYRLGIPVTGIPVGNITGALPPVTATTPYAADPGPPTAASSSPVTSAGQHGSGSHLGTATTSHRGTATTPHGSSVTPDPKPTRSARPTSRPTTQPKPGSPTGPGPTPAVSSATPTPAPSGGLPTILPTTLPVVPVVPSSSSAPKPAPSTSTCVLALNGTCVVP